jgi:hypothetical protein
MRSTHTQSKIIALCVAAALGLAGPLALQTAVAADKPVNAPTFQVDPFWPKHLPNYWILGPVNGIAIDSRDHVFITHRVDKYMGTEIGGKSGVSECCVPAPQVLEFDPQGNLVRHWGGPGEGYKWPTVAYGMAVDSKGNVWLGGGGGVAAAGRTPAEPFDSHLTKFANDGKFLQEIGKPLQAANNSSTESFGRPAGIAIDEKAGVVYVADGLANKRVAVLDFKTGAIKKTFGAYGEPPVDGAVAYKAGDPLPKQFVGPVHCARPAKDGKLYVCDSGANRIQVFDAKGKFLTEKQIAAKTGGQGAVWDVAFSQDKDQNYLYVADSSNMRVHVLDRKSLEVLYSFGEGGRLAGQWHMPRGIATDSKGNLYTIEEGRRVQKFVFQGVKPVTQTEQSVQWPKGKT